MLNNAASSKPLPVQLAMPNRIQREKEGAAMDERYVTHIILQHYRSSPSYSERETVAASHLGIGAIRHVRALGLIEGVETGGAGRFSGAGYIPLPRRLPVHPAPGGHHDGAEGHANLRPHFALL